MVLSINDEMLVASIVRDVIADHPMIGRKRAAKLVGKVLDFMTGDWDIYDDSLLDLLEVDGQVGGQRVLDIGAGGMNSSFGLLKRGASEVYVVDNEPFGISGWGEKLETLVQMQASRYKIDRERLHVYPARIGEENPDIPRVGQAFYFFPYPRMLRLEGMEPVVQYAVDHIEAGGRFTVVTELMPHEIHMPEMDGADLDIETFGGEEPIRFLFNLRRVYRFRPISAVKLTKITYDKIESQSL